MVNLLDKMKTSCLLITCDGAILGCVISLLNFLNCSFVFEMNVLLFM